MNFFLVIPTFIEAVVKSNLYLLFLEESTCNKFTDVIYFSSKILKHQAFPCAFICFNISEPNVAGDLTIETPAADRASNFAEAVPFPPETMAPA